MSPADKARVPSVTGGPDTPGSTRQLTAARNTGRQQWQLSTLSQLLTPWLQRKKLQNDYFLLQTGGIGHTVQVKQYLSVFKGSTIWGESLNVFLFSPQPLLLKTLGRDEEKTTCRYCVCHQCTPICLLDLLGVLANTFVFPTGNTPQLINWYVNIIERYNSEASAQHFPPNSKEHLATSGFKENWFKILLSKHGTSAADLSLGCLLQSPAEP